MIYFLLRFYFGRSFLQECCICLSSYEDGAELHALPCSHHFHCTCIVKWLKMNATCPLCKYNILKGSEPVWRKDRNPQMSGFSSLYRKLRQKGESFFKIYWQHSKLQQLVNRASFCLFYGHLEFPLFFLPLWFFSSACPKWRNQSAGILHRCLTLFVSGFVVEKKWSLYIYCILVNIDWESYAMCLCDLVN